MERDELAKVLYGVLKEQGIATAWGSAYMAADRLLPVISELEQEVKAKDSVIALMKLRVDNLQYSYDAVLRFLRSAQDKRDKLEGERDRLQAHNSALKGNETRLQRRASKIVRERDELKGENDFLHNDNIRLCNELAFERSLREQLRSNSYSGTITMEELYGLTGKAAYADTEIEKEEAREKILDAFAFAREAEEHPDCPECGAEATRLSDGAIWCDICYKTFEKLPDSRGEI